MGTERQIMQHYPDTLVMRADFPRYFTGDVVATFEAPASAPKGGTPRPS